MRSEIILQKRRERKKKKKEYLTFPSFCSLHFFFFFFGKQFQTHTHSHTARKRDSLSLHTPTIRLEYPFIVFYASAQKNSVYTTSIQQRGRSGGPKKRNLVRSNRTYSTHFFSLPRYQIILFERSHRLHSSIFFSPPKYYYRTLRQTHRIHQTGIQPSDSIQPY